MKAIVYEDKTYEQSMQARLNQSRVKVQNLLDAWLAAGFSCESSAELYELVWTPDIPWNEKMLEMKQTPPGLSKAQEEDYHKRLKLPDGAAFFRAAEDCRMDPYTLREQGVFIVKVKKVEFGSGAEVLIKGRTVYADSKHREQFALDLLKLIQGYNDLNKQSGNRLSAIFSGKAEVFVEPEGLREILARV